MNDRFALCVLEAPGEQSLLFQGVDNGCRSADLAHTTTRITGVTMFLAKKIISQFLMPVPLCFELMVAGLILL